MVLSHYNNDRLLIYNKNYLELAYDEYLQDIEKNVIIHKSSSYNVDSFKEYKIQKSKKYIDRLDDLVGEMYNLTKEQVDFIKNFEINVRISE